MLKSLENERLLGDAAETMCACIIGPMLLSMINIIQEKPVIEIYLLVRTSKSFIILSILNKIVIV